MTLKGKTAVVTGGGRGIGAAVARALAGAGASVVVAARTPKQIEEIAKEIGGRAVACDVTDPESIKNLAKKAGHADILVNNAGMASSAPVHKLSLEEWNHMFAVNATGTFLCTQAFMPAMVQRKWGRVINVASIAGLTGAPYISAYAASKHAVIGLTKCAAAEVAVHGVTVNAICPGYVDTAMTEFALDRIQEKTDLSRKEALQKILEQSSQGRLIKPEEVAHLVLSLTADDARSINGQAIVMG